MNIVQTFYDDMACEYDKLFANWQATVQEQALILDRLFQGYGYDRSAHILDCACGIGTQAIGLAALGYCVTGSDISRGELEQAKQRAYKNKVSIRFEYADFRALSNTFPEQFDIVIAMDNALPHMLTADDLSAAIQSIADRVVPGGLFVASIRDYDSILEHKPPYSPPYIHKTPDGQRVCFQTWDWYGDNYRLTQYILEDGDSLQTSKFECLYRAITRQEMSQSLLLNGFQHVSWLLPDRSGFYQPMVIAKK